MRWFSRISVLHAALSLILSTSTTPSSSPLSLAFANPLPAPAPAPSPEPLFYRSARPLSARNDAFTIVGDEHDLVEGAYPRAIKLQDGSLLATITEFSDNKTTIRAYKSTDSGSTWKKAGSVDSGATDARDLDNAYPFQIKSGRVLVAFRNHDRDPDTGAYKYFRITICASDDNGDSWTYVSTPASDSGSVNGNWEPLLRTASDSAGTLQLFYSRSSSTTDQDNLVRLSTDKGATWSNATTVSGKGSGNAVEGMMGVATVGINGHAMAVFESRSTDTGYFQLFTVESASGGIEDDWGSRKVIYTAGRDRSACKTRICNAGAPQIINVDGALVVSFMTDEDDPKGNWPNGAVTKLIISKDGGTTWTVDPLVLADGRQTRWPGMVKLDDGSLLALTQDAGSMAWAQKITVE
jgi:hypothetical protein